MKEEVMTGKTFNKTLNSVIRFGVDSCISVFATVGIMTSCVVAKYSGTDFYHTKALSYEERVASYIVDGSDSHFQRKRGFQAADVNEDGYIDFLRQDKFGNVFGYINNHRGTCEIDNISHFKVPEGFEFTMADVDRDGLDDLLLYKSDDFFDRTGKVFIHKNLGDFQFDWKQESPISEKSR